MGPAAAALRRHRGIRRSAVLPSLLVVLALVVPSVDASELRALTPTFAPAEIALRPFDLPPGFTITRETSEPMRSGAGVMYRLALQRSVTPEVAHSGPVFVAQTIARFDGTTPHAGLLDDLRRHAAETEGYQPVPDARNDQATASLQRFDGEMVAYQVGFVTGDMVVFTGWVGRRDVVTLEGLMALADISLARYDELVARGPSGSSMAGSAAIFAPTASTDDTPAGVIGPELSAGLRTLYGVSVSFADGAPVGSVFRHLVETSGVSVVTRQVDGAWGAFSRSANTVFVSPAIVAEGPTAVAVVLAHELTHLAQARRGADPVHACLHLEAEANQVQLLVWKHLREVATVEGGPYLREIDVRLLVWSTDGDRGLFLMVSGVQGYHGRCGSPGDGPQAPPPGDAEPG